ncbi:MAG: KRRI-Interacting protein 1 [Chrysothrix sp. TS-e1954]|nr:MAG: KRRI-Interacting protein 1 [Chrysothrix sp. TS-e1954]
MPPPAKKARLLYEDSDSESNKETLGEGDLKVNAEYAKRFEHNKKRAELHRLEEKYNDTRRKRPQLSAGSAGEEASSGSETSSESDDDEGALATEALDVEIADTLRAIRSKDPRVYDKDSKFFTQLADEEGRTQDAGDRAEKPLHLRDYHRKNLLTMEEEDKVERPVTTYNEEQDALKRDLLAQVDQASGSSADAIDEPDVDSFLVAKKKSTGKIASRPKPLDVSLADKDPNKFLTDYVTSRSWVPTGDAELLDFDSDDDEEDDRAEKLEAAYNLRFEDPRQKRENLISHARDATAKQSVRREDLKTRKKARAREISKKEQDRQEREDEKARLRSLKIEQAQEKLQQFKEAAGLKHQTLPMEAWTKFLKAGFDGETWDKEMQQHFDDAYYAGDEDRKKPKWDDDIDIVDIDPDFQKSSQPAEPFTLTDSEMSDGEAHDMVPAGQDGMAESPDLPANSGKGKRDVKRERQEHKDNTRKERRRIEDLVDKSLPAELVESGATKKNSGLFRYRATSPSSFGLTAADILMAEDSQLNQYAGLKKLASFRDSSKKARDRKKLGKKARLRQWRREAFGDDQGASDTHFAGAEVANGVTVMNDAQDAVPKADKPKKRRSHKKKHIPIGS